MGAELFAVKARGKTAQEAFNNAVQEARYDFGHAGYSGTIAEKDSFEMANVPVGMSPKEYVDNFFKDSSDSPFDDKWGPAGCVKDPYAEDTYVFFGWASS